MLGNWVSGWLSESLVFRSRNIRREGGQSLALRASILDKAGNLEKMAVDDFSRYPPTRSTDFAT